MATDDDSKLFLENLLFQESRTLTPTQWTYVLCQCSHEPTPLYLTLAARVVSTWTSTSSNNRLAPTGIHFYSIEK